MFSRIQVALGMAFLFSLVTSVTVFAKGGFSFITIAGPDLNDEVRATDPDLTTDFFAFADFYRDKTKAPVDPGVGYEITRYYIDGSRELAFDHLHYYPETGFVYYDGIVNGSSEYDGEWYTAKPKIQVAFESALPGHAGPAPAVAQSQPVQAVDPAQSKPSISETQFIALSAVITGLAFALMLAFRVRKPSTR